MLQKKHLVIVILVSYLYSVNCGNEKLFIECDPTKESGEKPSSDCPKYAKCVELGTKKDNITTKGLCACIENFTVNKNYSSADKNSRYCIENQIQTTQAPPSTTTTTTTVKSIPTTIQSTAPPVTLKTSSTVAPSPKPQSTTQATKKIEPKTPKPSVESSTKSVSDNNDKQHDKQQQQQQNEENKVQAPQAQAHHILGGILLPVMIVLAFIGVVYGVRKYDVLERAQNYIRNRRAGGQPHQTRYDGLENDFDDDPLLI